MENTLLNVNITFIIYLLVIVSIFFLIAKLLQWLWNITMPQVFDLKVITYWQSFRLLLIAGILFKGISFN